MESSFFSYSREDQDFALKLADDMRKNGISIWFDQFDIPTGSLWDIEIEKALKRCNDFIVIISSNSVKSKNVLDEISYAIEENKRIIPIKISNCDIPFRIRRLQYIDFVNNYKTGLQTLINIYKSPIVHSQLIQKSNLQPDLKPNGKNKNKYYTSVFSILSFVIFTFLVYNQIKNKTQDNQTGKEKRQNSEIQIPKKDSIKLLDNNISRKINTDSQKVKQNINMTDTHKNLETKKVIAQGDLLVGKWSTSTKPDDYQGYPRTFSFTKKTVSLDYGGDTYPFSEIATGSWYFKNNLLYINYSWPNVFPQEGVYKIILLEENTMRLSSRKYGIAETIIYEKW